MKMKEIRYSFRIFQIKKPATMKPSINKIRIQKLKLNPPSPKLIRISWCPALCQNMATVSFAQTSASLGNWPPSRRLPSYLNQWSKMVGTPQAVSSSWRVQGTCTGQWRTPQGSGDIQKATDGLKNVGWTIAKLITKNSYGKAKIQTQMILPIQSKMIPV